MNVESGMPPREKAFDPLRAQQSLGHKIRQYLPGKEFRHPGVIDPGDFVENFLRVQAAGRHQKMKMRVEIDAITERLNDRNDAMIRRSPVKPSKYSFKALSAARDRK